jgi:hypothetical protein
MSGAATAGQCSGAGSGEGGWCSGGEVWKLGDAAEAEHDRENFLAAWARHGSEWGRRGGPSGWMDDWSLLCIFSNSIFIFIAHGGLDSGVGVYINQYLVKAPVWFWWIDETLSANLVYQSDHKIGSTFQVVKQMVMIMMMV